MPCSMSLDAVWVTRRVADTVSNSGLLDKLIAAGKEYIFISNVDNLGAVVDLNIMQTMIDSQAEYVMEVTDKTKADIKGGTIIDYDGKARLLEVAQVPKDHLDEFCSTRKFKVSLTLFSKQVVSAEPFRSLTRTTSVCLTAKLGVWSPADPLGCNLKAIKRVMDEDALNLEIIVNNKVRRRARHGNGVLTVCRSPTTARLSSNSRLVRGQLSVILGRADFDSYRCRYQGAQCASRV